MLEKVRYVNSLGASLNFGENGIYVNENDVRNWEWSYNTDFGKIRQLRRKSNSRTLPVQIWAATEADGLKIKNKLHDLVTVDLVAGTPGRLYVGDCYLPCFITASEKSNYLISKRIMSVSLTVAADGGVWYQESQFWFGKRGGLSSAVVGEALVGYAEVGDPGEAASETVVLYDYDYPRGYTISSDIRTMRVVNDSATPCAFRLEIPGYAANPEVVIDGDLHKLHYTSADGQTIVVDSRDRTVKAVTSTGNEINLFRYRDKTADIFAPIPSGAHDITWNGDFIFGLTLYKERSEPVWT